MEIFDRLEGNCSIQELAENSCDVLYMFSADWNKLIFVNSAYEDLWGRSINSLKENPSDFLNGIHPEDREKVKESMDRVSEGMFEEVEFRVNGDENHERWVVARCVPIFNDDGELVRVAGFVFDITDRKKNEKKLQLERDRFQALFEHFNEPVVETVFDDGEPVIDRVNSAFEESFHVDEEDVRGEYLDDIIVPKGDEVAEEINEHALKGEPVEKEVHRGTDNPQPYLLRSAFFKDPEGEQRGYAIYTDISDIKEYEENLERQRDRLELLNRVLSHDIRNDLQVIYGMASILEEHVEGEGERYLEELLTTVKSTVDVTDTTQDLMDMMLYQGPEEPIPISETLRHQTEKIKARYENVDISIEGDIHSVDVKADKMLGSAVYNILQNAVEHNDKDQPVITVSTEKASSDRIVICIADNGPGISDDRKEKILEKEEKSINSSGRGLGLYIASTSIEKYGGDLWIEDSDLGGSAFKISLQIASES